MWAKYIYLMSSTLQKSEKIQLKRKEMIRSDVNYVLSVKEYVGVPQSHYKLPRNTEHSAVFFLFLLGTVSENPSTPQERTL